MTAHLYSSHGLTHQESACFVKFVSAIAWIFFFYYFLNSIFSFSEGRLRLALQ